MILPKSDQEAITGGALDEGEFGIEAQDLPIIFEFLRNKLYTDKHGAVVREIASNSRDAHRMVNTPERPIEISMAKHNPFINASDGTIIFTDYGPGISPQEMHTILTKYGKSTKRDTNQFTGGLGLGSKTPFSLVDQFIVESVKDGMEFIYSVFIDETKKGKFVMLHSEETTKPNQTSVVVPIDNYSAELWHSKINFYFAFWKVKPVLNNIKTYSAPKIVHETDDWVIIRKDYSSKFNEDLMFLLDEIPYPLQSDKIKPLVIENHCVLFKFNTGELNVTISRENLEYDNVTVNAIKAKQEKFKQHFSHIMDTHCDKFTTKLEAVVNYKEGSVPFTTDPDLNKYLFRTFRSSYHYKKNYNTSDYDFRLNYSSINFNNTGKNSVLKGLRTVPESWYFGDVNLTQRKIKTLNDLGKSYCVIIPNKRRLTEGKTPEETQQKLDAYNEFLKSQEKELKTLYAFVEINVQPATVSSIPLAPLEKRPKSAPKPYQPTRVTLYKLSTILSAKENVKAGWFDVEVDRKKKTITVPALDLTTTRLIPVIKGSYLPESELKKRRLFAFLTDSKLVWVTENQAVKFASILTPIDDLIKNLSKEETKRFQDLFSFINYKYVKNELGSELMNLDVLKDKVKAEWKNAAPYDIQDLGGTIQPHLTFGDREIYDTLNKQTSLLQSVSVLSAADVEKTKEDLEEKYPLLKHINYSNARELPNLIKEYIDLIDNKVKP